MDISKNTSDVIDRELLNHADYAITLCGFEQHRIFPGS